MFSNRLFLLLSIGLIAGSVQGMELDDSEFNRKRSRSESEEDLSAVKRSKTEEENIPEGKQEDHEEVNVSILNNIPTLESLASDCFIGDILKVESTEDIDITLSCLGSISGQEGIPLIEMVEKIFDQEFNQHYGTMLISRILANSLQLFFFEDIQRLNKILDAFVAIKELLPLYAAGNWLGSGKIVELFWDNGIEATIKEWIQLKNSTINQQLFAKKDKLSTNKILIAHIAASECNTPLLKQLLDSATFDFSLVDTNELLLIQHAMCGGLDVVKLVCEKGALAGLRENDTPELLFKNIEQSGNLVPEDLIKKVQQLAQTGEKEAIIKYLSEKIKKQNKDS